MGATDLAVRAKAIIDANAYMTIASADATGRPWASPVWFAHDGLTAFVWVSHPDARHSRNLAVRREVGIVVFDSTVAAGDADAVYLDAVATEVEDADLDAYLAIFGERSVQRGLAAWDTADVTGDADHRLYVARAVEGYVLGERDRRLPFSL
jgi:hypothetical protein